MISDLLPDPKFYKPVSFSTMSPAYEKNGGMKIDFASDFYFQISNGKVK